MKTWVNWNNWLAPVVFLCGILFPVFSKHVPSKSKGDERTWIAGYGWVWLGYDEG